MTFDRSRLDALLKRNETLRRLAVRFGSMGENGAPAPMHPEAEGLNAAQLLAFHEFGLGVPERTVIRHVVAAKRTEIRDAAIEGCKAVILDGEADDDAAKTIGDPLAKLLRDRIRSGPPPPLAPATLAKPDRDPRGIPLLDTETMANSLRWTKEQR